MLDILFFLNSLRIFINVNRNKTQENKINLIKQITDFMKINKFNLAIFAIIFFFSEKVSSQNTTTYKITPEINKKIISKYPWKGINVYHINIKKIKYYEYEIGEVVSKKYIEEKEILDYYKKTFEDKMNPLITKKKDLTLAVELIDEYLNSDLKFELKKEFLIQSQELVNKHKIHIIIKRENSFKNVYEIELLINNEDTKPNKNDLKACKDYLLWKLENISDPYKSNEYLKYISQVEVLEKTPNKESGMVKSQTESEREVRLVELNKVDATIFTGTFKSFSGEVFISNKNIEAPKINKSIIENEIVEKETVNQFRNFYEDRNTFRNGYVIEDVNTKEQYLIPFEHWTYLSDVKDCLEDIELLTILHDLGYKEYEKEFYDQLKGKYNKLFIKTKTAEIELKENDHHLYDMLKENKSILTEFDNEHNKLISLIKQCITYTNSLSNYINIYNIKRTNTPLATINAWRVSTISAGKLTSQINNIEGKYAFIYDLSSEENIPGFNVFLENLVRSQSILGITR